MDALKEQVGGNHYKKFPMQPIVFAEKIVLRPCVYSIFKYSQRYLDKNQTVRDLGKILHFISLAEELNDCKIGSWFCEEDEFLFDLYLEANKDFLNEYQVNMVNALRDYNIYGLIELTKKELKKWQRNLF